MAAEGKSGNTLIPEGCESGSKTRRGKRGGSRKNGGLKLDEKECCQDTGSLLAGLITSPSWLKEEEQSTG